MAYPRVVAVEIREGVGMRIYRQLALHRPRRKQTVKDKKWFRRLRNHLKGSTVYQITSLEDTDEPSTFRHALQAKGRRVIVPMVWGRVELSDG